MYGYVRIYMSCYVYFAMHGYVRLCMAMYALLCIYADIQTLSLLDSPLEESLFSVFRLLHVTINNHNVLYHWLGVALHFTSLVVFAQ